MTKEGLSNIIIHKVNDTRYLSEINPNYGVEFDVRSNNGDLILSHDPVGANDELNFLDDFIKLCEGRLLIANIKEAGIEERVINLLQSYSEKFFLLDCEMPFLIKNQKKFGKHLSIRYSKLESIETVKNFSQYVKWVWIDTYENLDLSKIKNYMLDDLNTVLVSPERWDINTDLNIFIKKLKNEKFKLDYVMTDPDKSSIWEANSSVFSCKI